MVSIFLLEKSLKIFKNWVMVYALKSQQNWAIKYVHGLGRVTRQFWLVLSCGTWKSIPNYFKWVYKLFSIPERCETLILFGNAFFKKIT